MTVLPILQTAAFVDATDSRYGFCSKDLRKLGGSELSRMHELMSNDHGEFILLVMIISYYVLY